MFREGGWLGSEARNNKGDSGRTAHTMLTLSLGGFDSMKVRTFLTNRPDCLAWDESFGEAPTSVALGRVIKCPGKMLQHLC